MFFFEHQSATHWNLHRYFMWQWIVILACIWKFELADNSFDIFGVIARYLKAAFRLLLLFVFVKLQWTERVNGGIPAFILVWKKFNKKGVLPLCGANSSHKVKRSQSDDTFKRFADVSMYNKVHLAYDAKINATIVTSAHWIYQSVSLINISWNFLSNVFNLYYDRSILQITYKSSFSQFSRVQDAYEFLSIFKCL